MWVGRPSHRRGEGPCRIPAGSPVPSSRSGTGSAPAPAGTPIPACSFPPTVDAARGGPPGRRRRRRSAGAARCGGGARRMPWPRWSPTASGAGCPRRTGNRAGGSPPERDRRRERSGSSSPAFTGIVHAEGSIHSWANQLRTNDDAPIRDGEHPPSFRALASAQVSYIRCSFGAYYREPRPYRGRVAAISGSDGSKEEVLWRVAPRTTDAPPARAADRFGIVVSTDVLSEGVNLQQARHIVNYDLPWNPMRLVQRHVRIDRIGSRCAEVFLRCIFPDRQLDELLGLEERLQLKLRQALASVGVAEVLPGGPVADISFTETRDEIERLRTEDASLFDRGGTALGVLSGEEYRQQLWAALEDELLAERIQRLPWGSGSRWMRSARSSSSRAAHSCWQYSSPARTPSAVPPRSNRDASSVRSRSISSRVSVNEMSATGPPGSTSATPTEARAWRSLSWSRSSRPSSLSSWRSGKMQRRNTSA